MKIDKAIEILAESLRTHESTRHRDFPDAIRLGIEALKELKESRKTDWRYDGSLLPGETDN